MATRELTVLIGGPGTGKTYTLTRCLAVLLSERVTELAELDIAVVAPTGKAAARAKELLATFVTTQRESDEEHLGLSTAVLDTLAAIEPRTIHSLLGRRQRLQTRFAHDAERPLPHEVVIVDEMSMVPTFLMARLLEAIRPGATVLLVGDQAQLESVESGSVLRGIVDTGAERNADGAGVFELVRVHRLTSGTDIGVLAHHIRAGESAEATADLKAKKLAGVTMVNAPVGKPPDPLMLRGVIDAMRTVKALATSTDPAAHREAYDLNLGYKVLCGPRSGPTGVDTLNDLIAREVHGPQPGGFVPPGTPLLVTVNAPRSRLVNGDIGLVVMMRDADGQPVPRVYFPEGDTGRYLTLAELPPTEVSYAMTVHKSQGSEYGEVMVFLPGPESPLLTRELLYTAVTRAKSALTLVGDEKAIATAIGNRSHRMSGLPGIIRALASR